MAFGLSPLATPRRLLDPIELDLRPGQIVLFIGPSGSGKSSALAEIEARLPLCRNVQRASLPSDRGLVDSIHPYGDLSDALSILSACGLGEAPLWLRRYDELSEGEKFRARLAKVIGLEADWPDVPNVGAAGDRPERHPKGAGESSNPPLSPIRKGGNLAPILCDEFCAALHRRAATAVAYNLRKLITRRKLCVVAAACDDTLLSDLQPDLIVRLRHGGRHDIERRSPRPRAISLWNRLAIEPGAKSDYVAFAAMHYREADELGFVDKVFVLRERGSGERLGIVVYAYPPLELALRNRATDRRFCRNPALLNREMRILRRLVIHPDVRGCGLGRRLVERTLPRVGVPYVECLASMGEVHPVFERAGMRRVGPCPLPAEQSSALAELKAMDVDPFSPEFVVIACRSPRVRRIVADAVRRWYRATSGEGARRVAHQSPRFLARLFRGLIGSRPVYYLWTRADAKRKR